VRGKFAFNKVLTTRRLSCLPPLQEFLSVNGLSLILRSHEGPDARDKRSDLGQVLNGYALDHDVPGELGVVGT
jgi:hypothetical protein